MHAAISALLFIASVDAWHTHTHRRSISRCTAATLAVPSGVVDGWLGDTRKKAEAEEAFGVIVATDEALWDENEFTKYIGADEWVQTGIDRTMLLTTFLALSYLTKMSCVLSSNDFEEFVTLPVIGRKSHNKWVVHGYVSPAVRIIRAQDGSASYGQWFLQTLEPDSTPLRLNYHMKQQNKLGCAIAFEKR